MSKTRTFKIAANVCRLILACTFIVSGFTMVIDPWGTALKVNEYLSIYGLDYLQPGAMVFSIWLCGAELMMGCMLLFKVRRLQTAGDRAYLHVLLSGDVPRLLLLHSPAARGFPAL